MIELKESRDCCGCWACAVSCPTQCITMVEDREGFRYPKIDLGACINCSLCEEVCPVINQLPPREPINAYAAKSLDRQTQRLSSSGGVFTQLAKGVIDKRGVVFGAAFDDRWEAHHVAVQTIGEIDGLRGSKYMQSRVEGSFGDVKGYLEAGRAVLFCGTPCQVRGLKLYLARDYQQLLTLDFVCHGTPSPKVWRKYLDHASRGSEVLAVNFREKRRRWQNYNLRIECNGHTLSEKSTSNLFMQGFYSDLFLRPSCHHCPTKEQKSGSDITIADFWGVEKIAPKLDDRDGLNLLIVNTQKGAQAISTIDISASEIPYAEAISENPSAKNSAPIPLGRTELFDALDDNFVSTLTRLLYIPLSRRIYLSILRALLEIVPYRVIRSIQRLLGREK